MPRNSRSSSVAQKFFAVPPGGGLRTSLERGVHVGRRIEPWPGALGVSRTARAKPGSHQEAKGTMSTRGAEVVEKDRDGRSLSDPRPGNDGEAEARGGSVVEDAAAPPLDEESLEPRPGPR